MNVTLKPQTEIVVPENIRRKAGFKPGDRVEFRVSKHSITIVPKLSQDELEDEKEKLNCRVRAAIRRSYEEFLAGKGRPIESRFAERSTRSPKGNRRRPSA